MKLRDFNISEQDIFETFDSYIKNPDIVEDHRRITCLLNSGLSTREVIREVGAQLSHRVYNISAGKSNGPHCLVAADYLTELGLLPFNIQNTRFELFNILSCFTHWGGSRSIANKVSNSNRIFARNDFEEGIARLIIEGLGATPHSYKKLLEIEIIGFDARLGRLMALLGHSEGPKKRAKIAPGQILAAWNSIIDPIHLGSDKERDLARRMIKDYILFFLFNRNGVERSYISMENPDLASKHANFLVKAGNYIFPSMDFRAGQPQKRKTSSFCSIGISISEKEIEAIPNLIRKRIESLIEVESDTHLK